jgi:hypothetical protein
LPVTIATASTGLSITESQILSGAGLVSQYIRGDGSLADFPATTGGGSSVSYYLNGSVSQGTIGGVAYKELNRTPVFGAGTDITINADGYIASFITDALDPNKLLIPAGNWNFETYFSASSSGGSPSFYVELYKYDGTTFTLIATSSSAPELIAFGTNLNPYYSTLAVPETVLALTDRLALRYYVTHSGRTITLHTENNHLCQVITTFTTGLTALNGITSQVQYLTVGTSGTDFAISSASDTHTFNLPTASATNRGALSSADWTTFNNKTSNLGTVTSVGLSSATSGVTIGSTPITTSGTITLAIATASGSQNGLLSSTDWTTFNGKQNALTNPVTGTGTSGQVAYFTGTSAISSESNLVWDATNDKLGIGASALTNTLSINTGNSSVFKGLVLEDFLGAESKAGFLLNPVTGEIRIGGVNSIGNYFTTFLTNNTERMRITQNGRVLIGTPPPTESTFALDVNGTGRFSSALTANNTITLIGPNATNNTENAASILFDANSNLMGKIVGFRGVNGNDGNLRFYTGNSITLSLSLASTGAATFSSSINAKTMTLADSTVIAVIESTTGTTFNGLEMKNSGGSFYFGQDNSAGNFYGSGTAYSGCLYVSGSNPLVMFTNGTPRMRITQSTGNVLIGTATDSSGKLQVLGSNSTIIAQLKSSSGMLQFYPFFSTGPIIQALDGAGANYVTLRIESSSVTFNSLGTGTVTATSGTLSTVSDSAFKIKDAYIDSAIEKVLNLKPRYFYWNEKSGLPTDKRQLGFYAQEVNEALGEEAANTPQDKNTPWGISDRSMIAMLTKAIQEQQEIINDLKQKIS